MNIIGIVCEYNPFHNGHLYQINEIKKVFPNSIIIVVSSSHITMRGEFSLLTKWDKTRIALDNNIDIFIELPFVFSKEAADIFSYAAIKILNELKIDTLVFGSESNDLNKLITISSTQLNNPNYDILVKTYMDKGLNYPTSISKAIKDLTNLEIRESNDILAVSYIKEIIKNNYDITPYPIKRTNNYKNNIKDSNIISAYEIRELFNNNKNINSFIPYDYKLLQHIDYNKYFDILKYNIITNIDNLSNIHLVDEGIEKRIYKSIINSNNYDDFISKVKTKRFTLNKINRVLINILMNFTKEDAQKYKELKYIRLLGMSKIGKQYLNSIKKEISLPVLTKFTNNESLNLELKVTRIYSLLINKDLSNEEIKNHVIIK